MRLYLTDDGTFDPELTLKLGRQYMLIILFQMFPSVLVNAYATTLRECGETKLPMVAGITAVLINFCLNYILIFGKFGAPRMGVQGAAVATVIARIAEMVFLIVITHGKWKYPFAEGLYARLALPFKDVLAITGQGLPLMINETMWSLGNTFLFQFYSTRGLSVVPALNITNTVNNLFLVSVISFGSAIGIIIGQLLGAGRVEEAKETDKRLIFYSVFICTLVAVLMAAAAPFIPLIYNTEPYVQSLATQLLWVCAAFLIFDSFFHACYFTLRAGGNTLVTIIFDSGFLWTVQVPIGYFLAYKTGLPILPFYILSLVPNLLKIAIGTVLLRKSNWARSLVSEEETDVN